MESKFFKLGHRFILGSIISLFFTASLLFFGPLNLYLKENENLWFSFDSILLPVIIIFLVAFIIGSLICSLPKEGIHKALCCLAFGIALALFIQGNFFNTKYGSGVLDGSEIIWKDYSTYGAIDSAMWAACIALPFALIMVFKKRWRAILITASAACLVIQGFMLTANILANKDKINKATASVTTDGIYELADKNNTLVFVLDYFDQEYLEDLIENDSYYVENLDGFTKYNEALSSGAQDILGFPSMISGTPYKKETTYTNYIDNIWSGDNAYTKLDKLNIDTRMYASSTFFGDGATEVIKNVVDTAKTKEANFAITKTIYKYTFFEYAQHYLKRFFWLDSSVFNAFKTDTTYEENDAELYMNFKNGLGFDYNKDYDGAIRIYSMEGANAPYTLNSDCTRSNSKTSREEQLKGTFKCIFSMFKDLKKNKKYKYTTIIITGNCGDKNLSEHPALLIKEKGKNKGFFENNAQVSMSDLSQTLLSLYTDTSKSNKRTFFNVKEDDFRTRLFYLNTGDNENTRIEEYKLSSKEEKDSDLVITNIFYTNNGVADKYELGTLLTFTMDATANVYCSEGFKGTTGWRTAIAGPYAEMNIPIKSIPKKDGDIHVYFEIKDVQREANCEIKANGKTVFTAKIDDTFIKDGLNFKIPTSLLDEENNIKLTFDIKNISEKELEKDVDRRTETISFKSFKMYMQ